MDTPDDSAMSPTSRPTLRTFVPVVVLLVTGGLFASSCGPTQFGSSTTVPPVQQVTSPQPVINQDLLGPLPQGTAPQLSISAVLTELQRNPDYTHYVSDPSTLTVKLGLYTYNWNQGQTKSVVAYVIFG